MEKIAAAQHHSNQKLTILAASLLVVTCYAFFPSIGYNFISLDDPLYVTANPHVRTGLSWENIRWAFMTLDGGLWHPLTWLSHMLDCQLFGLRAYGHHLTSLLIHVTSSIILFITLFRISSAIWRSCLVAALFALHPLHVETVVWISDRKDVLCAFFWILALSSYVTYARQADLETSKRRIKYCLTLCLFAGAMMSKSTAVTLPFVLLALDWWLLQRIPTSPPEERARTLRRLVLEKIPFIFIGFVPSLVGIGGQEKLGALPTLIDFPVSARVANAILSYGHYLLQTVWPTDLAIYYPYPRTFSTLAVSAVGLLGLGISILLLRKSRTHPYLLVGWVWYVITLLPAIGLVQVGGHARADRYTYVPLIGFFVILAWGGQAITERFRQRKLLNVAAATAAILLCLGLTRKQAAFWKDNETLFRHALAVTHGNELAHNNLGAELARQGLTDEAIHHFQQAVTLSPNYGDAHNNLATALMSLKRPTEAILHFEAGIQWKSADARTHAGLALALAMNDRFSEATNHFMLATQLQPDLAEAHRDWGMVLLKLDRSEEAALRLKTATDLSPEDAVTRCYYGVALASIGQPNEGIKHLREALRLRPDFIEAQENLRTIQQMKTMPARQFIK